MTGFHNKLNQAGVTLLELIVAVGIFALMMVSITGIFRFIIEGQRTAVSAQTTQESIRFVFETMSKEIRQAIKDTDNFCDASYNNEVYNTANNDTFLEFRNKDDQCVSYYLDEGVLVRELDGVRASTTPDELLISELRFLVDDNTFSPPTPFSDKVKPMVRIKFRVEYKTIKPNIHNSYYIQTAISSRIYD